jgi:hypothetical protein
MTAIRPARRFALNLIASGLALGAVLAAPSASADSTPQTLPFMQNWSNTGMITTNDDWSGVPGIIGYLGEGLTFANDVDPRTVLADGTTTPDVNANRTDPSSFTTGGVAEFELTDPAVALQGSGTASAPFLLFSVSTLGYSVINVSYNLRDLDGSADDAAQQFALHYRLGSSGSFANVAGGYVADATLADDASLVTPVSVFLPAEAGNAALLQLRVLTTNAMGSDEWVGIDDISITGAIPEPETYAMLLAGLGLLGFAARRRAALKLTETY